MKSPFPGMNPWLEGYLWPDVHNHLARVFAELLAPKIAPKYVARIEIATIMDESPESEFGIMYPDVEILSKNNIVSEPLVAYGEAIMTPPTQTVSYALALPIPVRVPRVEIRDVKNNKLITAIEILSPVNKRNPNLTIYQDKIKDLHRSGVHVLEIDLLRRGTRPFSFSIKKSSHYQMTLWRQGTQLADIWSIDIKDKLPILPVPLKHPDADVPLDLNNALEICFERSYYDLSIDYKTAPPPPAFSEAELNWIQSVVANLPVID